MKIQEWAEEEEDIEKKKMAEEDIEKKKKMEEWLEGNIEMKKKIEEWAAKKKKKTAKKKKAAKKKKKKTAKKKKKKIQEWAEEEDLEKKKKIQEWDIEKKKMEEWLEGNIEMNKNIEEWAWAEEEDLEMKKMKKKILEWAAEVREVPWKDQDQDSEQGWSEDLGLNIGQPPTPQSRSESSVDFEDLEYFIKMYEPKVEPEEYL
ncbi:uncharacterized protein M6B38_419330 [Iris pallida]|uniref:Uncharacterized protein n=1 Tax=Iris pallida TaxID=29817 RepID=A0AAX6FIB2_IRIPA|nr:uncharacterized protein M6B38_419330 [Iris pallida]